MGFFLVHWAGIDGLGKEFIDSIGRLMLLRRSNSLSAKLETFRHLNLKHSFITIWKLKRKWKLGKKLQNWQLKYEASKSNEKSNIR